MKKEKERNHVSCFFTEYSVGFLCEICVRFKHSTRIQKPTGVCIKASGSHHAELLAARSVFYLK